MNSTERFVVIWFTCLITVFVLIIAALIAQPHFEAKTFNKFSEQKATYLDALVAKLVVFPTEKP